MAIEKISVNDFHCSDSSAMKLTKTISIIRAHPIRFPSQPKLLPVIHLF